MATITFDTHKYIKQLEAAGIAQPQAEALITVQRDILSDVFYTQLASKADILRLENKIEQLDSKIDSMGERLDTKIDLMGERLDTKIDLMGERLDTKIEKMRTHFENQFEKINGRFENLELRMTIKLGTIVVIALGACAAIVKLL